MKKDRELARILAERKWPPLYRALAIKALGRPLPPDAEVHHFNGDHFDNRPCNLIICPNHAYHALLHLRMDALEACGNPDFRKCWVCEVYDDPKNLSGKYSGSLRHKECHSVRERKRRYAKNGWDFTLGIRGKKLNETDVLDIKNRLLRGEMMLSIAKKYGVNKASIKDIKHERSWKNVKVAR